MKISKVVMCMFAFLGLSIGITIGSILIHNRAIKTDVGKNQNDISGEKNVEIVEDFDNVDNSSTKYTEGIDLYGTYNENSIILEEIEYKKGKIEGSYIQIKGLKNKKVEEKINKKLKDSVVIDAEKHNADESVRKVEVSQYAPANFSDVLSVSSYILINGGAYADEYYGYNNYINVKLSDGEDINLEDLFIDDADVQSMVYSEVYENLAWDSKWNNGNESDNYAEYWEATVTEIDEKELVFIINNFKNRDNVKFYFNPKSINLVIKDKYVTISMEKVYSQIAIYGRFKSKESLYEDDSIGKKNIVNMSIRYDYGIVYEDFGQKSDNLYVDSRLLNWELESNGIEEANNSGDMILKKIEETYIEKIKSNVNDIEQIASENKDKGIVWLEYYRIYKMESGVIDVYRCTEKYTMSKEYYESDFYDKVLDACRHNGEGGSTEENIYIYIPEEAPVIKETANESIFYSAKNAKKLKEISDFFKDGYDYKAVLKQKLNEFWFRKYGVYLDEVTLEEEFEQTEFVFAYGNEFVVYNKNLGYNEYDSGYRWSEYSIKFESFDSTQMEI